MCPHVLIPYKPINPKTRLSGLLDQPEREAFARAMLEDVIFAVKDANSWPVVIATELYESEDHVQITIADADLNATLNALLPTAVSPLLILMADLPLANAEAIKRVFATEKDVAFVPGRGGGTNAIFIRDAARFHVDYYGASYQKHVKIAEETGLSWEMIDSFRLHTDIDEKDDLVELLIHGTGKSREYLESLGFRISEEAGRVGVVRNR
jgi:2-phospho-L-lactate/phosphoenolpyruvate guanylyltransferase